MADKINAVVCGVNFGRFYIDAFRNSKIIKLNGILSKGSEKSQKTADELGIKLFTEPDEINNTDIVVMAAKSLITGGRSGATVKKLIGKGISVIQEQPVHIKEVEDIVKNISADTQKYYVNNFYRYLPAVKQFLYYAEKLRKEHHVLRLRLSCASQVLYPLMDVVYDAVGGVKDFTVKKSADGNMSVLTGTINSIPFILDYYNEYTEDIDGSLALFFDIKMDTNAGNLILNDPEGDVIWQSHLSYSRNSNFNSSKFRDMPPLERLYTGNTESYSQRYLSLWPAAMEESVIDFYNSSSEDMIKRTIKQCEMCSAITLAAGRPKKISIPYIDSVSLKK